MPWSYPDNIPDVLKNKPADVQKECIKVGNETLKKTSDEESAIFAMIACSKRMTKSASRITPGKSLAELSKGALPSHITGVLNRPLEESLEYTEEDLGCSCRELVNVTLDKQDQLIHEFDTGKKIKTDLSVLSAQVTKNISISAQRQEVFINEQPEVFYPAISFSLVEGANYYTQSVNVP